MKKTIIAAMTAIVMFASVPISASAFMGKRQVIVDGFALSGGAIDKSNSTFVPFRELFTQLGLSVKYDSKNKKVTGTKGKKTVTFTVGSKTAYINGKKKTLQVAPFNSNGSVYVPLRVVSEATGSAIKHISNIDVVLVNSPSFEGSTYSSPNGTLTITKNGKLSKSNNLVLMDFLNFMSEENIVLNKDVATENKKNDFTLLTPDTTFEIEENEFVEDEELVLTEEEKQIMKESEEYDRKVEQERKEFLEWVAAQEKVREEEKAREEAEREKIRQEILDFLDQNRNQG